jgi:hypothetical protein
VKRKGRGRLVHQGTAFGRRRGQPGERDDATERRKLHGARDAWGSYPDWMESVREQQLDEAGGLEQGVHAEMRSAGQALERR